MPEDARFCSACGADLGARDSHEERKVVSVLFIDMVGSTARADGADPEDVRELNRLYLHELRDRIERYGGVLEKFIGDAVVAVFGAPLARDDDAERAVRAALDSLEGIEELNRKHPELELQIRAAVCTGEALVTLDAGPVEPLATGDIVNTAARLQSAAPPGRVIVGEDTFRFTKDVFSFASLDPIEAKGKRDRIQAWLVSGVVAEPAFRRRRRRRWSGGGGSCRWYVRGGNGSSPSASRT
jgi:class 3 adenylate cyclase